MKVITSSSKQFETLKKGFNLRFPENNTGATQIALCNSYADIIQAYANAMRRPNGRATVRSGGHCYEGFVSDKLTENEELTIIDISQMKGVNSKAAGDPFISFPANNRSYDYQIMAGNQNWETALSLYHKNNVALPAGSCYAVGVGGHISGGGYGFLSRANGLTVDHLVAVDILVPDTADGKTLVPVHVHSESATADELNLLYACRGAGGGQFGIIVAYYFNELPTPPEQVYWLELNLKFEPVDTELAKFERLLAHYHTWFETGQYSPDTYRLFTKLELRHVNTGDISIGIQYYDENGKAENPSILKNFLDYVIFSIFPSGGVSEAMLPTGLVHAPRVIEGNRDVSNSEEAILKARKLDWLTAVQNVNGIGQNQKGRYKSAYQKGMFDSLQLKALWNCLRSERAKKDDIYQTQTVVQIQSYGGKINNPTTETSACQRDSILKWQPQSYWKDSQELSPEGVPYDKIHHDWLVRLYQLAFKSGVPGGEDANFDGCYINYPDMDMTRSRGAAEGASNYKDNGFALYFPKKEVRNRLINTKKAWDKFDMFKNQMSVKPDWNIES